MKTTLILTCCNKLYFLKLCLPTILKQNVPDLEILVISDTPYQDDLIEYCTENNVRFHFTQNETPRTWCVTANEGVRLATGENIILCHAEIYHIDKVLVNMIDAIKPKTVVHPIGYDDQNGKYLKAVQEGKDGDLNLCTSLNTRVSFIQGFRKADYVGFDEDFAEGHAFEDVDFSERMEHAGCTFVEVPAKVVHLFHKRGAIKNRNEKWERNRKLIEEKRLARTEPINTQVPTVSFIIFCKNRLKHLVKCWPTIKRQLTPNIEVLVISDTPEQADLKQFCAKNKIRCHFTGYEHHRTWCVAANESVRLTTGDVVIFNHAEMYHTGNVIKELTDMVYTGKKIVAHPLGYDDNSGFFLGNLNAGKVIPNYKGVGLDTRYSYIQAFLRENYLGYDEAFADGHGAEDIDFFERMVYDGFVFKQTPSVVIHLYHKRGDYGLPNSGELHLRNRKILEKKRHDRSLILHGEYTVPDGNTQP